MNQEDSEKNEVDGMKKGADYEALFTIKHGSNFNNFINKNTNRKKLILHEINNCYHVEQTTEHNKFLEFRYLFRNFCFRFEIISEIASLISSLEF